MPTKSINCAACTKAGRSCVNISWKALESQEEKTQREILDDLERWQELMSENARIQAELSKLASGISRKRKFLAQTKARADKKMECLVKEVEAEDDAQRARNGGFLDGDLAEMASGSFDFSSLNYDPNVFDWDALGLPGAVDATSMVVSPESSRKRRRTEDTSSTRTNSPVPVVTAGGPSL